jgi:hypothetical protein
MQVRSRHGGRMRSRLPLLALALMVLTLSPSAEARRDRGGGAPQFRGDSPRLQQHDGRAWRGGHSAGHRHGSRLSWSIGIGLLYPYAFPYPYAYPYSYGYAYPYGYPVYPYPNSYAWQPPLALAAPQVGPPAQYWYYCEASGAYYPYVATCPDGWREVPATPSDASPVPQQ